MGKKLKLLGCCGWNCNVKEAGGTVTDFKGGENILKMEIC